MPAYVTVYWLNRRTSAPPPSQLASQALGHGIGLVRTTDRSPSTEPVTELTMHRAIDLARPPLSQAAALFADEIGGQREGGEGGDNRGHRRDGECRGVPAQG